MKCLPDVVHDENNLDIWLKLSFGENQTLCPLSHISFFTSPSWATKYITNSASLKFNFVAMNIQIQP